MRKARNIRPLPQKGVCNEAGSSGRGTKENECKSSNDNNEEDDEIDAMVCVTTYILMILDIMYNPLSTNHAFCH